MQSHLRQKIPVKKIAFYDNENKEVCLLMNKMFQKYRKCFHSLLENSVEK